MSFGPRSGPPKAAEVSSSTRDLLDSMMQNKNMSRRLKGDIVKSLQSGSADWIEHWSSGKVTSRLTESQKWARRALPQVGREKKTRDLVLRLHGDAVSKSGKKSSKDIEASGDLEREEYTGQGVRGKDRDQMKRELQDTCQFAHLTPQASRGDRTRKRPFPGCAPSSTGRCASAYAEQCVLAQCWPLLPFVRKLTLVSTCCAKASAP